MKDRARPEGEWENPGLATLLGTELETIDVNASNSFDVTTGGAYAPSDPIDVGGGGVRDATGVELDIGASETTSATFTGITANRVNVIRGSNLVSTNTIIGTLRLQQGAVAPDGIAWECSITQLNYGARIIFQDFDGSTITTFRATRVLRSVWFRFERRDGAWKLVHVSDDTNRPSAIDRIRQTELPDEPDYHRITTPCGHIQLAISGIKRFLLDHAAPAGASHVLRFDRLLDGASLRFYTLVSGVPTEISRYEADGAGERNVSLTFEREAVSGSVGDWRLAAVVKSDKTRRTFVLNVGSGAIVPVIPWSYRHIRCTRAVQFGETLTFKMIDGSDEGDECFFVIPIAAGPTIAAVVTWTDEDNDVLKTMSFGGELEGTSLYPSAISYNNRSTTSYPDGHVTWFSDRTIIVHAVMIDRNWRFGVMI